MPDYSWNPKVRRYERAGKIVEPKTVRGWIEVFTSNTKDRLGKIAEDYRSQAINRSEWFLESKQAIKEMHMAAAMVAQGGREAMTPQAWGRTGGKLKSELSYLKDFNSELFNGKEFSDAEFIARAMKYSSAGYKTYQNGVMERDREAGVKRILRVLDEGAKNCGDCPGLAGEYDIKDVPAIGESACGGACNCYFEEVAA